MNPLKSVPESYSANPAVRKAAAQVVCCNSVTEPDDFVWGSSLHPLITQSYQWQLSGISTYVHTDPKFCLPRCKPEGETFLGAVGVPTHLYKIVRGTPRVICGNMYIEEPTWVPHYEINI